MKNLYKNFMKTCALCSVAGTLSTAANAADKELLDILLGNSAITQAQYEELLAKEEMTTEDVEDIVLSFGGGSGLNVSANNGDFEVEIGGRLHLEYAQHENDSRMGALPVNGSTTRRARLEMDGLLYGKWGWAAEFDFAENKTKLKDVKMGYEGEKVSTYWGHQKQPYSLSLEMSSNDIPFLERSVDNAMVAELTDRAIGVRVETSGDNWFFAGGLFGDEIGTGVQGDEGWATMGRFVYAPIINDDMVVHLGIRGALRSMSDPMEFRVRDETTDWSNFSIVDTGTLNGADEVTMYGPEFAFAMGPLTLMGEYSTMEVSRVGVPDAEFDAWHIGGAISLTGDNRAPFYRMSAGEFKGVRPGKPFDPASGQWGGFELVARYASIDLNDGSLTGGNEDVVNAGVNWYLNRNIRFLFDWTHILDTDESNTVRLYAPGMDLFRIRTQYNY
ncbi:MAG: phosphate-selective porin OprO/OprP [Pseudohongiellaceae bacterium]|jgi:phosphate-selective porin OprO/OprP